jgi:hypothetical protein
MASTHNRINVILTGLDEHQPSRTPVDCRERCRVDRLRIRKTRVMTHEEPLPSANRDNPARSTLG